jgi:tetratricopeptide (TPR) repeat protein
MSSLATAYYEDGRFEEAENLQRETLESRRRVLGPDHPETLLSMNSLADICDTQGRHAEAEALYREILDRRRRVLGEDSPDTLLTAIDLAEAYRGEERYGDSEKVLLETLAIQRRNPGADHPNLGLTLYALASTVARRGEKEKAMGYLRDAIGAGIRPDIARKIEGDSELAGLRGDPRFAALVAEAKKVAAGDE